MEKKQLYKIIPRFIFLSAFILFTKSIFVSCSKPQDQIPVQAGSRQVPGWKLNCQTPVTFTWYINFNWYKRFWGKSIVSQYITEKTGVSIDFTVPHGDESEEFNSMIVSGNLPDIITVDCREGLISDMIREHLVYPLEYLAKNYDPYFFKAASQEKLSWYTQEDGHIYGYPNASFTLSDYAKYRGSLTSHETFLVRNDIYQAIGCPDMSTPEGFLQALKDAKEKFPFAISFATIFTN